MLERGVIDRIGDRMLPDMPKCRDPTTFHSARIADVYSAFIILAIGIVIAVCIGLVERIWSRRLKFKNKLRQVIDIYLRKKRTSEVHTNKNNPKEFLNDYINNINCNLHFKTYKRRLRHSSSRVKKFNPKVNYDCDKQLQTKQIIFPFRN